MIIVNIMGGLGNQMFQYAAAKSLATFAGTELKINSFDFLKCTANKTHSFQLDRFNISAPQATKNEIEKLKKNSGKKSRIQRFMHEAFKLSNHKKESSIYYEEPNGSHFKADFFSLGPETYLYGYFNSYKYFEVIRNTLLHEFTPNWKISPLADETLLRIKDTNSVSLHLRRGDYVNDPQVRAGLEDIITDTFYKNAIAFILDNIEQPHFFVFSNDIQWAKDNFMISAQTTYVDFNSPQRGFEDLWVMSKCKHNITAGGSTFSWWAAYLNQNPEKKVITTAKINNDSLYNHPDDFFPAEWLTVPS